MILYSLACDTGHRFDSWFRDSAAFDDHAGHGHVKCPVCRSDKVVKAIMAPAVVGTRAPAPSSADAPTGRPDKDVVLLDERARDVRRLLRGLRDKLVSEGDDVGPRFAAEARRIHEGEAPRRQIYGQASVGEARELIEDGIAVLPLPILPDELN